MFLSRPKSFILALIMHFIGIASYAKFDSDPQVHPPVDDLIPAFKYPGLATGLGNLECPDDTTVVNDPGSCQAQVFWIPPITLDDLYSTHTPGDIFPVGTTEVVYTAVDRFDPLDTTRCTFEITVLDNEDPVISNCPSNQIVSAGDNCNQVASWTPPTASDNCGVVMTGSHSPGETFPVGSTTVTYTATDPSGNSTTCSFDIIVVDDTPPVIVGCNPSVNVFDFDPDKSEAKATWTEPTVSDNCDMESLASSHDPGDKFPVGITMVTYTGTDKKGNVSTCSFEVEVVDPRNSAPEVMFQTVSVEDGATVTVCMEASDAEGHNLTLTEVTGAFQGFITNLDQIALCFDYTAPQDFTGSEVLTVTICDDGTPQACTQSNVQMEIQEVVELQISQIVTPNGDNINDIWFIGNIDKYPNNRVRIFDRWGNLIYSATNYDNSSVCWHGGISDSFNSQGRSAVPSGTYYYQLEIDNGESFKGFLELVRP